ncbi:MAG: sulfurtransferase [Acidimicrobiales bacterium]|nr:sulfurtransferase [Acidimicrobiales bacterium]
MDSLVDVHWLAEHLDDPDLRILECTVDLVAVAGGFSAEPIHAAFDAEHIPNSAYVDLANELSDPDSELRFTVPSAQRFAAAMEAVGVGEGTRVVLYDRRFTMWATRVFWMLKAFGFDECAVLDGGLASWKAEGFAVADGAAATPPSATFVARPRPGMFVGLDEVEAAIEDAGTCIVNALSPQNHDGTDPSYGRPGHIPGATNVFAVSLVDPDTHRYLPADELAAKFAHLGPQGRVISYCGGGIAATSDAFVLSEILGRPDVAVYDGSLSEWIADPSRPLEV